jgi:hypothetical protein
MIRIETYEPLYEMANFSRSTTGENFELWIDDSGKDRNVGHNLPRVKPKANGIELDIIIDGDNVYIDHARKRDITKFKYSRDAIKFVKKFRIPLLMHWNREIDTAQLGIIIRLVVKKNYSVQDAINAALNDDF